MQRGVSCIRLSQNQMQMQREVATSAYCRLPEGWSRQGDQQIVYQYKSCHTVRSEARHTYGVLR